MNVSLEQFWTYFCDSPFQPLLHLIRRSFCRGWWRGTIYAQLRRTNKDKEGLNIRLCASVCVLKHTTHAPSNGSYDPITWSRVGGVAFSSHVLASVQVPVTFFNVFAPELVPSVLIHLIWIGEWVGTAFLSCVKCAYRQV